MLKFLFNRNSPLVIALEVFGVLGFFVIIFKGFDNIFFYIFLICYLLIRFCATWNWYRKFFPEQSVIVGRANNYGIIDHFKKMRVAAAYFIFITNLFIITHVTSAMIYISLAVFAFIIHLNGILLFFHFKDKDSAPPNFYSTSH